MFVVILTLVGVALSGWNIISAFNGECSQMLLSQSFQEQGKGFKYKRKRLQEMINGIIIDVGLYATVIPYTSLGLLPHK